MKRKQAGVIIWRSSDVLVMCLSPFWHCIYSSDVRWEMSGSSAGGIG
jgi:hypothetical protein